MDKNDYSGLIAIVAAIIGAMCIWTSAGAWNYVAVGGDKFYIFSGICNVVGAVWGIVHFFREWRKKHK